MGKKAIMATIIITAILISLEAGMQAVEIAKANPYITWGPPVPGSTSPTVEILSPINKTVYSSGNISLSYNLARPMSPNELPNSQDSGITDIQYTLDNVTTGIYHTSTWIGGQYGISNSTAAYQLSVSDGNHSLTLLASGVLMASSGAFKLNSSSTVLFTVDTTGPNITIFSLENKTYVDNSVPLNFAIDEPASWIGYSVDNNPYVTITGNSTLSNLTGGSHKLIIYANDEVGNMGRSNTVFFSVNTSTPSPSLTPESTPSASPQRPTLEPSPTASPTPTTETNNLNLVLEIAGVIAVVIVVVGLMVYYRKRRG